MRPVRIFSWSLPLNRGSHIEHRLRIDGRPTSYFITSALSQAGRTGKVKYGLFGPDGAPPGASRPAADAVELGRGERIRPLKIRAELLARARAAD